MFCPKCGTQLPDGSKFCGNCGAQLGAAPAQPAGASQVPPAPQVPGVPVSAVPGGAAPKPKRKVGLIVAGVAAVVVVALAIWGIVSCVGGGNGSAQGIADGVDAAFNTMIDGDFSSDSLTKGMDGLIDLMPPEAVQAALDESGMTRDDLREEMSYAFGDVDQISSLMGLADITFSASLGEQLDEDDLAGVNDTLEAAGVTSDATEGYNISYSMEISALGQSQSQDLDESGLFAVKIGNSWYLWGSNIM